MTETHQIKNKPDLPAAQAGHMPTLALAGLINDATTNQCRTYSPGHLGPQEGRIFPLAA